MEIITGFFYKNKKNKSKYIVSGFATNKTNAQDNQKMVIYSSVDSKILYVRRISEFETNFESCSL